MAGRKTKLEKEQQKLSQIDFNKEYFECPEWDMRFKWKCRNLLQRGKITKVGTTTKICPCGRLFFSHYSSSYKCGVCAPSGKNFDCNVTRGDKAA